MIQLGPACAESNDAARTFNVQCFLSAVQISQQASRNFGKKFKIK